MISLIKKLVQLVTSDTTSEVLSFYVPIILEKKVFRLFTAKLGLPFS